MQLSDFDFTLPSSLIAQYPLAKRSASRLLLLDKASKQWQHRQVRDLPSLLQAGDLCIFNDTKVIPARIYGHKASGGKIECLLERMLDSQLAWTHIRSSKAIKADSVVYLGDGEHNVAAACERKEKDLYLLRLLDAHTWPQVLQRFGHIPLPPYIQRADEHLDKSRYQTIFARQPGAVAAPTAGLHFDEALLAQLAERGIQTAYITLHVGAGTFQPIRVEDIRQHHMHEDWGDVSAEVCDAISRTKAAGHRVIAVGTTAVRSLESAAQQGQLQPFQGQTDLFIYPGYHFRVVDAIMTNFHLPKSSLLLLMAAFVGRDTLLAAYQAAIAEQYRFFSYGDAMLVL